MDEILPAGEPSASADVGNAVSPSDPSPEDERLRLEVTYGDASFSAEGGADTVLRAFTAFKDNSPSPEGRGATESKVTAIAIGAGQGEKRHPATYLGIFRRLSMEDGSNM